MKFIKTLFLFIPLCTLGQTPDAKIDSTPQKAKIGHDFYVKTEVLNSLTRLAFVKGTYDIDLQIAFRLNNHLHLVNTYGQTTFDLSETVESYERPKIFMHTERKGTSFHRSSCMLRYYPFNDFENWQDYLFIESGFHFQNYKGLTNVSIYDSTKLVYENKYFHELNMYRYGPQINLGMSSYFQRADLIDAYNSKKTKVIFSPEFFIGVYYNQLYIQKDEVTNYIGSFPNDRYSENKLRLTLRAKIGIGF